MKIKFKLLFGFFFISTLVLVVGGLGIYSVNKLTEAYGEIVDETAPALLALGNIKAEVLRMQVEALSGDMDEFENAKETLEKWEQRYEEVAEDEEEQKFVKQIEEQEVLIYSMGLEIIKAKDKKTDDKETQVLLDQFEELEELFENIINVAITVEETELVTGDKAANELSTNLLFVISMTLVIATIVSVGFSYYLASKISSSIYDISTVTEKFAGDDLSIRVQLLSNDEIGDLGRAFNAMADKLEKTITVEAANELRAFNQQLTASQQQLKASNQQLKAYQQQLQASNQQLSAKEQALRSSETDLKEKLTEMERFNKVMVGRENVMLELKEEINVLLEEKGNSKKYTAPDEVKKT